MFHDMPASVRDRMAALERIDLADRIDGTTRMERLRQVPPLVGRFIALLAASSPPGRLIEIGTSAGYSALWLALACRQAGRKLTTYEVLDAKAALARETFDLAEVWDAVELVHADARLHLPQTKEIAFCFLDAEKEVYGDCYELVVPGLVSGGILVADNAINHEATLRPMLDRALADDRVDAMIVPVANGELICRRR